MWCFKIYFEFTFEGGSIDRKLLTPLHSYQQIYQFLNKQPLCMLLLNELLKTDQLHHTKKKKKKKLQLLTQISGKIELQFQFIKQLISLLQHMSTENIEQDHQPQLKEEKGGENKVSEELLEEVRNLKKVISALAERESMREKQESIQDHTNRQAEQNNPESQFLQSKIRKTTSQDHKLSKGQDIYKNVRNDWKVRITSKQRPIFKQSKDAPQQQHSKKIDDTKLNLISQNEDEKTNLDDSIINKHLSFLNSRADTDEQQPAKTQFFAPQIKHNQHPSNQFRFKKIDFIPAIDNQHNRFRSYITSQRKNLVNNRNNPQRQSSSFASNGNKVAASQPELPKRKKSQKYAQSKQGKIIEELKRIEITRQTEKELLIENGKKLFKIFYDSFNEELLFTIKKYKNCIVFSLLPTITKAIIFHYVGDIYFGNISLDEKGRIQKNGLGIQIVKQRHYYEGHFINGKKNGRGKIQYENGDIYDGQWNDGEIYGFGRYIEHKNDRFYEGFWKKGQYCGQKSTKQPIPFQFF